MRKKKPNLLFPLNFRDQGMQIETVTVLIKKEMFKTSIGNQLRTSWIQYLCTKNYNEFDGCSIQKLRN